MSEEKTHSDVLGLKQITPEELWNACDFTSRDSIVTLFPSYIREQYQQRVINKKNVTKSVNIESFTLKTPFGDQILLKSTELVLEQGKRQGLVGPNNCGKTLLFTNMSEGKIKDFPKHVHVHHCRELETHELSDTVLGTVVNSHPYRNMLLKVQKKLVELIAADPAPAVKDSLQTNKDYVDFELRSIGGLDAEERASKMLRVLGFDEHGQAKLCSALSGGLRMRVALCMAFFIDADLLLLDEPTNHLDFPSVLWLENRLRGYKGSFLLVSHDRELLNNVCTSVLLIEDKQIKYYTMGFKEFEKKKAADDKKKFDDIEKFLQKNQNADPSTLAGKQKAEKRAWSENYYQRQVALAGKFTFPTATPLQNDQKDAEGNLVKTDDIALLHLTDCRFKYIGTEIFIFNTPIEFKVTATTRVGVMGPNGAGKSTLLKLLTQKLIPTEGNLYIHPSFTLAYFGQHSTAELNLEMTPSEWMGQQFPGENAGSLRNHLAKTSIVGTTQDTRMERLSFSQRSCIIFAKLTYVCPHLLILDEPTNFLDLESVDSLISACNKYKGALLLVSHNRDFLKRCAKQYLSVVPGHFKLYDDLKTAEQATYTFIAEMENGGKVGATALANNPGGGSVHASQRAGGAEEKKSEAKIIDGVKTISISSSTASVSAAAKPAAAPVLVYAVGEKCQALWSDGKFYAAVIKKVDKGKYTVTYTQYGNTVTLPGTSLKKAPAQPEQKGKPAGKK